MPGSFKSTRDHNTLQNDVNEVRNATSSIAHHSPSATAMRAANVANPHGSVFDISSSPTSGSPNSYDFTRYGANNALYSPVAKPGHGRRLSFSDTVKAGATSAANSAAAAGASIIDAGRKLMHLNDDDEGDEFDQYDGNEGILPTTNHPAGTTRTNDNNRGLEFSHRSMATKKPSRSMEPVETTPLNAKRLSPEEPDLIQGPTREPFERRHSSPSLTEQKATVKQPFAHPVSQSTSIEPTAATSAPEVKRIPIAQPPPELLSMHSTRTHTNNNNNVYATAAAGTTAVAAGGLGAAAVHHGHHSESAMNRARDIFNTHSIPKDNTFLVALTQAKVLLAQQEYLKKHHNLTLAMQSTSASYNAPKGNMHSSHHNHREAAVIAAPVTVATAAGVAANLGSWKELPTGNKVIDKTLPPAANQHTAYVVPAVTATAPAISGLGSHVRDTTYHENYIFDPQNTLARSVDADVHSPIFTRYTGDKLTTAAPTANRLSTSLNDKELSTAVPSQIEGHDDKLFHKTSSAAAAAAAAGTATGVAMHSRDMKSPTANDILHFTDPSTLRPLTENRTFPIVEETCRPTLTDRVKDVIHRSSEYGPADPTDLPLTDPKTIGLLDRGISVPVAVATTAGVVGAGEAIKTHSTTTRGLVSENSLASHTTTTMAPVIPAMVPIDAPALDDFEATTTNAKSLKPLTARPAVVPAIAGTTAVAGAGAGVATMAKPSHDAFAAAPTTAILDKKTLVFTDPETLRPVTEIRTFPIVEETYRPTLIDRIKDVVHRSSEYGPADPRELQLTDPKTLGLLGEKAAVRDSSTSASHDIKPAAIATASAGTAVAAGVGAATMPHSTHRVDTITSMAHPKVATAAMATPAFDSKTLNFTDPTALRPLTEARTIPVVEESQRRSLMDKARDVTHSSPEYGPADPKHLELTDPRSLGHMGEKAAVATAAAGTAAAAAGAGAATTAKPVHTAVVPVMPGPVVAPLNLPSARMMDTTTNDLRTLNQSKEPLSAAAAGAPVIVVPPPQPPADMKTLEFTDPKTLRPLTELRILTIVDETYKPSLTDKLKEVMHRSSEYGPADPMDLQLTDPGTLRPLGEKVAAPVVTPVAAPVAAPVATATHRVDTATSSHMNHHRDHSSAKPSIAASTAGTAVAVGTGAGVAAMAKPTHIVSPVQTTAQVPMRTEIVAPPRPATTTTLATASAPDADNINFSDIKSIQPLTDFRTVPPRSSEYGSANPKDVRLADTRLLRPTGEKVVAPAKEGLMGSQSTRTTIPSLAPLPAIAPLDITLAHNVDTEDSMTRRPLTADAAKPAPVPTARPRRSTNPFANATTAGGSGAATVVDNEISAAKPTHIHTTPVATSTTTATVGSNSLTTPTTAIRSTNPFAAAVAASAAASAATVATVESKRPHTEIHSTDVNMSNSMSNNTNNTNMNTSAGVLPAALKPKVSQPEIHATTATSSSNNANMNMMDSSTGVVPPKMSHPEIHNTNMNISAAGVGSTAAMSSKMPHPEIHADNAGTHLTHQNHYNLTDSSIVAESSSGSASAPANTLAVVPENYDGPVPKVQPGEEIVWMKTTTTTTYPQGRNGVATANATSTTSSTNLSPAQLQKLQHQQEGSDFSPIQFGSRSTKKKGGFFSRLLGRHKTTDKGKQRV
ncbi:hypothetical protein BGX26_006716 [Mortierella sp. AD094]|nr:hypothetical protein BGX26_006716 [Mortierella sp. AD094]